MLCHLIFINLLFNFSVTLSFSQNNAEIANTILNWTWVAGSNTPNQNTIYGTKGIASSGFPGARIRLVSWTLPNNLWLFGGFTANNNEAFYYNDLWKFDGSNWIWISGSDRPNQIGVYGTKGIGSSSNVPGTRCCSASWADSSNNLWLFGGEGNDAVDCLFNFLLSQQIADSSQSLNDLWKFDGRNWTWISGSDIAPENGNYGTLGIASPSNVPGPRLAAMYARDSKFNFWLYGGNFFNDLWKFDGGNWTWISGSSSTDQSGNYGVKGVAASSNVPGSRYGGAIWIDSNNIIWLFGGYTFGLFLATKVIYSTT